MAQSGLSETVCYSSAYGGKADNQTDFDVAAWK
jgi:hypothetical protein